MLIFLKKRISSAKNTKMQIKIVKNSVIFSPLFVAISVSKKLELENTSGKYTHNMANGGNFKNSLLSIIKFC